MPLHCPVFHVLPLTLLIFGGLASRMQAVRAMRSTVPNLEKTASSGSLGSSGSLAPLDSLSQALPDTLEDESGLSNDLTLSSAEEDASESSDVSPATPIKDEFADSSLSSDSLSQVLPDTLEDDSGLSNDLTLSSAEEDASESSDVSPAKPINDEFADSSRSLVSADAAAQPLPDTLEDESGLSNDLTLSSAEEDASESSDVSPAKPIKDEFADSSRSLVSANAAPQPLPDTLEDESGLSNELTRASAEEDASESSDVSPAKPIEDEFADSSRSLVSADAAPQPLMDTVDDASPSSSSLTSQASEEPGSSSPDLVPEELTDTDKNTGSPSDSLASSASSSSTSSLRGPPPQIEVWGASFAHVNGIYHLDEAEAMVQNTPALDHEGYPDTLPESSGTAEYPSTPPCYQKKGPGKNEFWLYLARDSRWWIGTVEDKDDRKPHGWLASDKVKETLSVGQLFETLTALKWEAVTHTDGAPDGWKEQTGKLVWLPEEVAEAWESSREVAQSVGVLEVSGVLGERGNGKYDYIDAKSGYEESPVFQHQSKLYKWLFVGKDGQWWAGMDPRGEKGIWMHSGPVTPGTLPWDVMHWMVQDVIGFAAGSVSVVQRLGSLTATDIWRKAREKASDKIELWGLTDAHVNGAYELVPAGADAEGAPWVYRNIVVDDVWLYIGNHGHWMVGPTESKDTRESSGWLRGGYAVPGTPPDEAKDWQVHVGGQWKTIESKLFWSQKDVGFAWAEARDAAAKSPVIEINNRDAHDRYNFVPGGSALQPPVYQYETNKEAWLYLASDGKWWVGRTEDKEQRKPHGWLHSSPVLPGKLPTDATKWLAVVDGGWQLAPDIKVK